MKARILTTLVLLTLVASASDAQDAYSYFYGQAMQFEAQKQAIVAQYVERHGYENLYAEYVRTCEQVAQYGYDCSILPFEQHIWLKAQEEAGIDTRANFQAQIRLHQDEMRQQRDYFNTVQHGLRSLQDSYDRYNRGWEDDQRALDQVYADRSAVQRGTWDYSTGNSDVAVTLPHAPDPDDVYTDGTYYYTHDGYDWLQYDNDELRGPSVIMQPLPNVAN